MALSDDLETIAEIARGHAGPGEELGAVIPAEPADGLRVYLCAFTSGDLRSWLGLDRDGRPVANRSLLADAVSIAALCELAEEHAGGLDEIEEPPRMATPAYLDAIGAAARRREQASAGSDFAQAMKMGSIAVEGLMHEVETTYKVELD
jgi:hypothetical protein